MSSHNNKQTTTVLLQLYRSFCVSRHFQLRTGGFCWCRFHCLHALAYPAPTAFVLGRRRWSSRQFLVLLTCFVFTEITSFLLPRYSTGNTVWVEKNLPPPKVFWHIFPTTENFKIKLYGPIACSYLCKITKVLGGLAPKPLIKDNIFIKTESAYDTYYIVHDQGFGEGPRKLWLVKF